MKAKIEQLKKLKLANYSSKNVWDLNCNTLTLVVELNQSGFLTQDILLTIVQNYTKITVEEFCVGFIAQCLAIEDFISRSTGKIEATLV